jgi:hypothetical protein
MKILQHSAFLTAVILVTRVDAVEKTVSLPSSVDSDHTFFTTAAFPSSTSENIKILFGNSQHLQVSRDSELWIEIRNAGYFHDVSLEYGILGPTLERTLFKSQQTTLASISHNLYLTLPAGSNTYGLYLNLSPPQNYYNSIQFYFRVFDSAIIANGANCVCCACGDYNYDGSVNASDYVAGRKEQFSTKDFNLWRSKFGNVAAAVGNAASIPEPNAGGLIWLALAPLIATRRK